jgi:phosphoglycerate dehydrogenase-like enzyme
MLDASMKVKITDQMILSAPRLRIISCATTGSDHIQRGTLNERGIPVRTLKEDAELLRNITPAAELSWALLMACARRLLAATRHVIEGGWNRELFPGIMLNGKCLGLIGCGRIGGWMARYGHAFGMDVIGYDPHLSQWPDTIRQVSLVKLMETSDFVSIHVHLNPETEGLVSRHLIERIKPSAVVINTSRGAIIDQEALLAGLRSGRIYGVGLDVITGEPDIAGHPLVEFARKNDNVLITPHCGGFSPDAVRVVCAHAAEKIRTVLVDETDR